MRTTVRIDDDLLFTLKQRALAQNVSVTKLLNQLLRRGLKEVSAARPKKRFRQQTFPMGVPTADLTKAMTLAAEWEDQEILRKLALRK